MDAIVLESRSTPIELVAYAEPSTAAPWRGIVAAGAVFEVVGHVTGRGCGDWGAVATGAFVCLDRSAVTTESAEPVLDAVPLLYGRRARPGGRLYKSLAAFEAGALPIAHLEPEHSYAFVRETATPRGEVLVRPDGAVVPKADVNLYTPSAFQGRDLRIDPLPAGAALGWCVAQNGCGDVAYHQAFVVTAESPAPSGTVRVFRPAARPEGVADDEVWVDIDLAQETLAILRGDTPEFVTLVSTGVGGRYPTPRGIRRVVDKLVENDMTSLPDAPDPYHVERVPWVVHFRPRISLHAAYWHDRFGLVTSHGCVNLSPADAKTVFDAVEPHLPPGWRMVRAEDGEGSVVRVR